jgi:hypothetical protein
MPAGKSDHLGEEVVSEGLRGSRGNTTFSRRRLTWQFNLEGLPLFSTTLNNRQTHNPQQQPVLNIGEYTLLRLLLLLLWRCTRKTVIILNPGLTPFWPARCDANDTSDTVITT